MPLMTYDQVRPWARSIKSKVLKKEMPPWGVGRSTLEFSNDRQMSEKEIFTLVSWVDAGAPKGNDADLPAPPAYPGGWKFNREPGRGVEDAGRVQDRTALGIPDARFLRADSVDRRHEADPDVGSAAVEQGGGASHHGQPA